MAFECICLEAFTHFHIGLQYTHTVAMNPKRKIASIAYNSTSLSQSRYKNELI